MRSFPLLLAVLALGVAACGDDDRPFSGSAPQPTAREPQMDFEKGESGAPTPDAPRAGAPPTGQPTTDTDGSPTAVPSGGTTYDRQIIRTGEIALQVESLDSADRALVRLVAASGGFIAGSSRQGHEGRILTGTTELRVPSARFDGLVDAVRRLGKVESENITASDVTEEYIDLEARLKGQQQLEARVLKLLEERPGKLADVVEIEQKLAEIRAQIESIQGRLRYLSSRVQFSSLTVRMTEPGGVTPSTTETFGGRIAAAFHDGIDGLVSLLAGLITVLLALLPIIALAAVVWIIVRKRLRRRKAAEPGVTAPPGS